MPVQKDDSTDPQKIQLRRELIRTLAQLQVVPWIVETHGGIGKLYSACYSPYKGGVVFEHDPVKAQHLAQQRPTWAVYEAEVVEAVREGAADHVVCSLLDVDPYGSPWPVLRAWFESERPRAPILGVAVNDGLRHKVRVGGAWKATDLEDVVLRYGNKAVYDHYLDIAREMLDETAAQAGYRLSRFTGYYTGQWEMMTHYAAVLTAAAEPLPPAQSPES